MNDERIIDLLASIAASLAEIAHNTQRELPEEPDIQRPIEQYAGFAWHTIDAEVVKADEFGAAIVEWGGRLWTRRSPENKFGEAIWFSRAAGKDENGTNRYLRLITFRKVNDAEPLSRGAERVVRQAAAVVQVAAKSAPVPEQVAQAEQDFGQLASAGEAIRAAGAAVQRKLAQMVMGYPNGDQPATDEDRRRAWMNLAALCKGDDRKIVVWHLYGREHFNELTSGECRALCDWIRISKAGDERVPSETAVADLKAILAAANLTS